MRTVSLRLSDLERASIPIGFVGEHMHTQVRIDCLKLFEEYPTATPSMIVNPPKGDSYPAVVVRDGDFVIWNVTDSDLIYEGSGEIQLKFTVDEVVAKSYPSRIRISRSIPVTGEIPDPVQNWIDNAENVLEAVEDAIPTGGTTGQVLAKKTDTDYDLEWVDQSGGGTSDYDELTNKPQIAGVTLAGNKSLSDLGIASTSDVSAKYTKPSSGIPASDLASGVIPDPTSIIDDTAGDGATNRVWSADKVNELKSQIQAKYTKPQTGIPASDLASGVIPSIPVTDVRVSGTSVVSNGVANVPVATDAQVTTAVDTYLAANFSNPSNPPLDRTLASNSSATPADISGRIKTELTAVENETTKPIVFNWVHGGIDSSTGAYNNEGSTTRSRDEAYRVSEGMKISNGSTKKFWVIYYTLSNGSYTFKKSASAAGGESINVPYGEIVRFDIRGGLSDAALVTGVEGIKIVNDLYDTKEILMKKGSKSLYKIIVDKEETTYRGITYSITNGIATFSGTADSQFNSVNLFGSGSGHEMLTDFEVGKEYFVKLNKTGTGKVGIAISAYDSNGDFIKELAELYSDGSFTINSLSGVSGMVLRYRIPTNSTVNCTLSYVISTTPGNDYLYDKLVNNKPPVKIRIMQNNSGHFNYGTSSPKGIPSADVNAKILNYKNFLCDIQPDILCMQECDAYIDRNETIQTDSVFSPTMPNVSRNSAYTSNTRATYSVFPVSQMSEGYLYTPDQENYYGQYTLQILKIGSIDVAVMDTAFSSTPDEAHMAIRAATLSAALSLMDSYDYAFIVLDMNNSGSIHYDGTLTPGDTAYTSDEEGQQLLTIAQNAGFSFANGAYRPFLNTLGDDRTTTMANRFSALDNIVYKNNGKVVFKGFKVYNDHVNGGQTGERTLCSDHYPVYADFILH